jgi:hypothetical protein
MLLPSWISPEVGDSMFVQNFGIHFPGCNIVQQPGGQYKIELIKLILQKNQFYKQQLGILRFAKCWKLSLTCP